MDDSFQVQYCVDLHRPIHNVAITSSIHDQEPRLIPSTNGGKADAKASKWLRLCT